MLAASAAVLCVSSLALAHATATVPESSDPVLTAAPSALVSSDAAREPVLLNERHVTCIAKVVHHEASNQPRSGQIAVAQVLMNRVRQGFGRNVCAVARQPGQFFNIDRYNPDRRSHSWSAAESVARAVLAGEAKDHSRGALFFRANWARRDGFFRTRTKVARLDDHDFYR
jgi:N-acetylmuramoyl-L-alanine amidase